MPSDKRETGQRVPRSACNQKWQRKGQVEGRFYHTPQRCDLRKGCPLQRNVKSWVIKVHEPTVFVAGASFLQFSKREIAPWILIIALPTSMMQMGVALEKVAYESEYIRSSAMSIMPLLSYRTTWYSSKACT